METLTEMRKREYTKYDVILHTRHYVVACAGLHHMHIRAEQIYASTDIEAVLEFVFVFLGDYVYGVVRLENTVEGIIKKLSEIDYLLTYLEIK